MPKLTIRIEAIPDGAQWLIIAQVIETEQQIEFAIDRVPGDDVEAALRRASKQIAVALAPNGIPRES